jgi:hypothetical protein
MRGYFAVVPLLLLSSTAYSQSKGGSYNCVAEWPAGGWYNSASKKWEGSVLNPPALNLQFILKMTFVEMRTDQSFARFNISITKSGSKIPVYCRAANSPKEVSVSFDRFRCSTLFFNDFVFDLNTNRFLHTSAFGYVDGKENNDNTPYIAGGTCAKIE